MILLVVSLILGAFALAATVKTIRSLTLQKVWDLFLVAIFNVAFWGLCGVIVFGNEEAR